MRRWLPVMLWMATVAAGRTAEEPASSVIRDIAVVHAGHGQVDAAFVLAQTRLRVGDTFDRTVLAQDVRAVLDSDRFTAVEVDVAPRDDGVSVRFVVTPKWILADPVAVEGVAVFRLSRVRDILKLRPGDRVDDHIVGVRVRDLRDAYVKEYRPAARIDWQIVEVDRARGLARVVIAVDEGPRARVAAVRFEGNAAVSERALLRAAGRPAWYNPMWLFRARRYSPDEIETLRLNVRNHYRALGYLNAAVDDPEAEHDARGRQDLTFRVHEGERFRIGAVAIEGVTALPEDRVEAQVTLREGATASAAAIEANERRIEDLYGTLGYAHARVRAEIRLRGDTPVADILLRVREGERITIGNIRIRGNHKTRDKVIRRELSIHPGEVLNEVAARRSERRLHNLGFFSDVRRYTIPTAVPNREDVVFDVEEKSTGQFMIGAGFSSIDNIIGFAEVSQGNFDLFNWPWFTGGGQKLKLRAQAGSERRDYQLSFVEPWFLDRTLSLGLDLYLNDLRYTDYELRRTGAGLSLSHPLPGPHRVTYKYSLEDIRIVNIADTNAYVFVDGGGSYFFSAEEDRLTSTLNVTLLHDTRDNAFIPTRGLRASLYGRLSGGWLGFDTDVYGLGGSLAWYVPVWRSHVLSLRGRYDVIDAYGDTEDVPISERLFAGGGRTLRGFRYRDVGPKVRREATETEAERVRPVGGRTRAIANIEYTIPIVERVRVAMFYDIGGVWADAYDFDQAALASGAGVGLRLDLPGFPIRIDRAWVVDRDDPLTQSDDWLIWIGYDY